MSFLVWEDNTVLKGFPYVEVLGVNQINELSDKEFYEHLKMLTVRFIKQIDEKYNGYDINNALFSRLQLNKNLSPTKYKLVSDLRTKMWNIGDYLTVADLDVLFN